MSNKLCPVCGHEVHGMGDCKVIVDESWDGEDESVILCDCALTPFEAGLMIERDEASKLAAMMYYGYAEEADNYSYLVCDESAGWHSHHFKWCAFCGGVVLAVGNGKFGCERCKS